MEEGRYEKAKGATSSTFIFIFRCAEIGDNTTYKVQNAPQQGYLEKEKRIMKRFQPRDLYDQKIL